jgi:hypothetical protein
MQVVTEKDIEEMVRVGLWLSNELEQKNTPWVGVLLQDRQR